jgi:hypothetical protein
MAAVAKSGAFDTAVPQCKQNRLASGASDLQEEQVMLLLPVF